MPREYLTMRQLRDRGWNDRQIRHYLGDADDRYLPPGRNPGRPQRLYLLNRVVDIETSHSDFVLDQARRADLAERTRRAAEVKMRQFQDEIDAIDLPHYEESYADLIARARRQYRASSSIAQERLALNLLLDTLKPVLERALGLYAWHPGIRDARLILKHRVIAHIVKHYPALAAVAQIELGNVEHGRG